MRNVIFFFLCTIFSLTLTADTAPTFHALIVADTKEASKAYLREMDIHRLEKALNIISAQIRYEIRLKILRDDDASKKNVISSLKRIDAKPDDIVFFAYTGHGSADSRPEVPWPMLCLRTPLTEGIAGAEIINFLRKGPQRLTCIFFSACNHDVSFPYSKTLIDQPHYTFSKGTHYPGLNDLFLNYTGTVAITSSHKGEYSYSSRENPKGSIFLRGLIRSIVLHGLQKKTSWDEITNSLSLYCVHKSKDIIGPRNRISLTIQNPYGEIVLKHYDPSQEHKKQH